LQKVRKRFARLQWLQNEKKFVIAVARLNFA